MIRTKQLLIDIALSSALTLTAIPVIAAGPALSAEAGVSGTAGVRGTPPAGARSSGAEVRSEGGVRMENTDMQTMPSTPSASPGTTGGPTLADPAKSPIDFSSIDSNKDGKISVAEYLKQGGTRESFRQSDKNGDNKLDSSELIAQ